MEYSWKPNAGPCNGFCDSRDTTEKSGAWRSCEDERSWGRCTVGDVGAFRVAPQVCRHFWLSHKKHIKTVILYELGRDADVSMKSHSIPRHSYVWTRIELPEPEGVMKT